jgi:hypothetical protein
LTLLLSLSKEANASLKAHLALFVGSLLTAIGENESQVINYVAVRCSADELEVVSRHVLTSVQICILAA